MGLVEQILQHDRARRAGDDAAVPATGGRRVVCVTCTELVAERLPVAARFGLDADQVLVVAVPGARVPRPDGDVARAVALAAGAAGGTLGGADVIVLGHDACAFRSPTFAVPGPSQQGESFPTTGDLLRAAVTNLRASPWMARTNVHALVLDGSGRLDAVQATDGGAPGAAAPGSLGGAPPGAIAAAGPVSFFGAPGAAPSLSGPPPSLGAPPPLATPPGQRAAAFAPSGPSSLAAPGAVRWDAPGPLSATSSSLGAPAPLGSPSAPVRMPETAAMPTVGPMPTVGAGPAPPQAPSIQFETADVEMLSRAVGQMIDAPAPGQAPPPDRPPPPPPPKGAPHPAAPAKPAAAERRAAHTAPSSGSDDPFRRAEDILEKLRRERRR